MKKFIVFLVTATMTVSALGVTAFAEDTVPAETLAETESEEDEDIQDGDVVLDAGDIPFVEEEPTPAPPEKATAVPANAKIAIDGKEITFAAYNIDGNNYLKLRDLAIALKDTNAAFDVLYDTNLKAIRLNHGNYTGSGSIDATIAPGTKEAKLSTTRIILPTGAWMDATEARMTGYNIDGFTYFKLREVANVICFYVDWNPEAKVIAVDTNGLSPNYPEEDRGPNAGL